MLLNIIYDIHILHTARHIYILIILLREGYALLRGKTSFKFFRPSFQTCQPKRLKTLDRITSFPGFYCRSLDASFQYYSNNFFKFMFQKFIGFYCRSLDASVQYYSNNFFKFMFQKFIRDAYSILILSHGEYKT